MGYLRLILAHGQCGIAILVEIRRQMETLQLQRCASCSASCLKQGPSCVQWFLKRMVIATTCSECLVTSLRTTRSVALGILLSLTPLLQASSRSPVASIGKHYSDFKGKGKGKNKAIGKSRLNTF